MPRKPEFITFTGVDERTDIGEMAELLKRYPIEWGILFSASQSGVSNRFPGAVKVSELLASPFPYAAHLCGEHVRNIMGRRRPSLSTNTMLRAFRRIQVNHHTGWFDAEAVAEFAQTAKRRIICHFPQSNFFPFDERFDWLFDASFGAGREPDKWPRHPGKDRLVGYSGGIGPDNVKRIIETIGAKGPYWIDMENNVRTDDWLDLKLCRRVCEEVYG